jgi:hypothetical protein
MLFSREWKRRKGSNPGGLVISGSLPNEPSPAIQLLPSGFGELIAFIEGSHVDALLRQLSRLILARQVSL